MQGLFHPLEALKLKCKATDWAQDLSNPQKDGEFDLGGCALVLNVSDHGMMAC